MLSLIRSGPKILIMASDDIEELSTYLVHKFDAKKYTLNEAFENSTDEHTIALVVDKIKEIIHVTDIKAVINIREESDVVLCNLFNDKKQKLLTATRIAPRILVMRALGNIEKIIREVQNDYPSTSGSFLEMLDNHNGHGTILTFTSSPLNKKIGLNDLYQTSLFVEEKYSPLRKGLRIHGLKYLNEGIDNKDWYELEIKIYDKYEAYQLHYKRLLKILEYLELGLILGESWGKDAAHVLLLVGVYRIRFFTFYEPEFIKRILLGLEYLEDGTRIVDYDVFHKRRKIYWTDVREKELKTKTQLSKKYRKYILDQLAENQREEIFQLEEKILQTRD